MNHAIHVEQPAGIAHPPKRPIRSRPSFAEQRIELRLRRLGEDIQALIEAPYPGLFQDWGCIRETLEELTARHTTLLWIARVAKCTEGGVRERLWLNIERALASLEKVAGSLANG